MRIAMFLFHTFHNDHRVLKEARSLIDEGNEVILVAARESDSLPAVAREEGIEVRRIRLHRWPFRKGRFLEYFLRAAMEGWRIDADVYHCHDLDTLLPGFLASRRRRAPLVYDSHELYSETHFLIGRKMEQAIWNFLERHLIRQADRVITVSDPIAEELRRRYAVDLPAVVRNIPAKIDPPEPAPFFETAGDTPLFLCQGYLQPGRGLPMLVRAMRHVPRGRLVLLGDGELTADLVDLVSTLGLQERVHILPAVPIAELPSRTAAATVGLIAYSTDSLNFAYALPNKFFEYIMAGVPVLTSPLPEVARLVERYSVGRVVDPCDEETFAREMNRLASDPEAIALMKEKCAAAIDDLQWAREEEKLLSLYREIASTRN